MIGAVQIIVLGYNQPDLPTGIRNQINLLRTNPAIRIIDVYGICKSDNRVLAEQGILGLDDWDGALIREILQSASASRVLHSYAEDRTGYLVPGGPIPDLKASVPAGSNIIVLLVEHLWANALETSLRDGSAFPVAGAWVGRQALENAGLALDDHLEVTP